MLDVLGVFEDALLTIVYSRHFHDRRMGSDVDGKTLGDEFEGYTLRITGGNDKQGFSMKQGILVNGRVRILMKESKYSLLATLVKETTQPAILVHNCCFLASWVQTISYSVLSSLF